MSEVKWIARNPDQDDSRTGWYKCLNCGELGFDEAFCPKCGEGAMEVVADLRSQLSEARALITDIDNTWPLHGASQGILSRIAALKLPPSKKQGGGG